MRFIRRKIKVIGFDWNRAMGSKKNGKIIHFPKSVEIADSSDFSNWKSEFLICLENILRFALTMEQRLFGEVMNNWILSSVNFLCADC